MPDDCGKSNLALVPMQLGERVWIGLRAQRLGNHIRVEQVA
jgi:hypothetical protein